jgi:hypothetical protein
MNSLATGGHSVSVRCGLLSTSLEIERSEDSVILPNASIGQSDWS